jgi:hypothetical protein
MYEIAGKYFLPKPYLSYSAMNDFYYNRKRFQDKYYRGIESPVTPELVFGKRIGELLENDDESLRHITRYDTAEQKLDFKVDGIPVLGFMDTFDSKLFKIGEYKTGKTPWTQGRVNKHFQLDVYSLGVETIFGQVDDECVLIWLETQRIERPVGGRVSHHDAYGIEFTGKVKEFTRTITSDDRAAAYEKIVTIAQDISEDYTDWLSTEDQKSQARCVVKEGRGV